jgi:hypothetical protein
MRRRRSMGVGVLVLSKVCFPAIEYHERWGSLNGTVPTEERSKGGPAPEPDRAQVEYHRRSISHKETPA